MLLFHVSETRALDASPLTMDDGRWTMDDCRCTMHHGPLMTATRTTLTAT